jgi:hypothetical protein
LCIKAKKNLNYCVIFTIIRLNNVKNLFNGIAWAVPPPDTSLFPDGSQEGTHPGIGRFFKSANAET